MAKLRRGDLKQIVKECLVEILAEGLAGDNDNLSESRIISSALPQERKKSSKPRPPAPDRFNRAVSRNVSSLTSDPLMASLFEDTARGTLQEQLENDGKPGAVSMSETAAPGADLSDVFGDRAAQNWASLAFDGPSKK